MYNTKLICCGESKRKQITCTSPFHYCYYCVLFEDEVEEGTLWWWWCWLVWVTLPYNLAKAGGTVVVYMMMIIVSVSASQTWLGSSLVFFGFPLSIYFRAGGAGYEKWEGYMHYIRSRDYLFMYIVAWHCSIINIINIIISITVLLRPRTEPFACRILFAVRVNECGFVGAVIIIVITMITVYACIQPDFH